MRLLGIAILAWFVLGALSCGQKGPLQPTGSLFENAGSTTLGFSTFLH